MNSSQLITCRTPALPGLPEDPWVRVEFILDNLVFDFATLNPTPFSYEADPILQPLNPEDPSAPFRHKPGRFPRYLPTWGREELASASGGMGIQARTHTQKVF